MNGQRMPTRSHNDDDVRIVRLAGEHTESSARSTQGHQPPPQCFEPQNNRFAESICNLEQHDIDIYARTRQMGADADGALVILGILGAAWPSWWCFYRARWRAPKHRSATAAGTALPSRGLSPDGLCWSRCISLFPRIGPCVPKRWRRSRLPPSPLHPLTVPPSPKKTPERQSGKHNTCDKLFGTSACLA